MHKPKEDMLFLLDPSIRVQVLQGCSEQRSLILRDIYIRENSSLSDIVHHRNLPAVAAGHVPDEGPGMPGTQQDLGRNI